VLAAALEIIDRDGADALSMRRLARALNRDPMIPYRDAPSKAALLDGVAETVLAQLQVDSADPDWAGQLRGVARRFRALALAHPHVVPLIAGRATISASLQHLQLIIFHDKTCCHLTVVKLEAGVKAIHVRCCHYEV
jgi:AcrR family transcriptional regulator